ncbi:hypothetical protein [Methylobacterium brachythecii]|uniref:Uncharacterized protein n=1 Tax=Methylobacterium brachythecii TaxID=1176177 RepID=A0A7W6ANP4_9HYPH|nr:hypothetical protein [Methylobacterium brachythecii]MBB3905154.1 hypothetical protein [Methylobacterium brachythecii]GLS44339.1 hypothetical protein GCM10007884_23270 [Methylobacterium brachythecii]
MNTRMKTAIAAAAVTLGLAAAPASAQVLGSGYGDQGSAAGYDGRAPGYNDDGTLNVFGAHIDPPGARGGLVGGVGNVVGGVTNGVGSVVGGVVGGVTGAADDVVTGSTGGRYANGRPTF